jgi:hypothetical protein
MSYRRRQNWATLDPALIYFVVPVDMLRELRQDARPYMNQAELETEMSRHLKYQRNATRARSLGRGILPCAGGTFEGRSFSGRMPMA